MDPASNHWDQSGHTYAMTVYDPLALIDADGKVQPYLARSITHNADYTEWTITARPGVAFHDGTALDGAAIAANLERTVSAPLTGAALSDVANVSANGDAATVTMKRPWVPFDTYLVAGSQLAYMASPQAGRKNNLATNPVGTGPYVFDRWTQNSRFVATRNPHYWRPNRPWLDAVEYRPIVDSTARANSLRAGDIDGMYISQAREILDFRSSSTFTYADDSKNRVGEPTLVSMMVNTAVPPVDDLRVRQAMAYATDQKQLVKVAGLGVGMEFLPITGPFLSGSPYYSDTGYPSFDLAKAKALVQAYTQEKGSPPKFKVGTTTDPTNLQNTQLLQAMWQKAGLDVSVEEVEQATYITNALVGSYQVYGWIQFGAADPDQNYVWWSASTAAPVGTLSLNFARNKDPQVEDALVKGRTSADPAVRTQAYRTVAKRLAEDLPYIWAARAVAAYAAQPKANGLHTFVFPDGTSATAFRGLVNPTDGWLSA